MSNRPMTEEEQILEVEFMKDVMKKMLENPERPKPSTVIISAFVEGWLAGRYKDCLWCSPVRRRNL